MDGLSARIQQVEVQVEPGRLVFSAGDNTYNLRAVDSHPVERERDYLRLQIDAKGGALVFRGEQKLETLERAGFGRREKIFTRGGRLAAWLLSKDLVLVVSGSSNH